VGQATDGAVIPVVLCIDLEPDGPGHVLPPPGPWVGGVEAHAWLTDARSRIEAVTDRPARFTWALRMDPFVEAAHGTTTHAVDAHPDLIADVLARGDEVGVHVHGWRQEADGAWVDDYRDPAWFAHCIDVSLGAFTAAFDAPARISRLGNRFSSPAAMAQLAAAGVTHDLSAEAACTGVPDGYWPSVRGPIPDYRRTPRRPHQVASGLTELPLSATSHRFGWWVHAHLARMRRHGLRERLDRPMGFGKADPADDAFPAMVARALRHQRRPYLAFALRSGGMNVPAERDRLVTHLDQLLAMPEADRFAFVGPAEAVALVNGS
jgi:hypothetical protein